MNEPQSMDPQAPITLSLNLAMVQGVLVGLGKLPYEQAAVLINIIQGQVAAQLKKTEDTPEDNTGENK